MRADTEPALEATMELNTHEQNGVTVLAFTGSIRNEADNEALAAQLDTLATGGHFRLALDFSDLEYINSRAIGDLMGYYFQVIDRGGLLAGANAPSMVRTVLGAAGVETYIPLHDTLDAAIASLNE